MRVLLAITGALIALILLAVAVFVFMPAERLAQIAIDRLAEQTGREITIDAATRPTLWPDLVISVEGLEVANPDWAGARPLLRADVATLRVGWRAVFGNGGTVDRLELSGAEVALVRAEDGRLSWRNGEASLLPLALQQAQVRDARLRYEDQASGREVDLRRLSASVDLNEGAGGSAAFVASSVVQGQVMELSGTITQAARFFDGSEQPVRLDLVWGDGRLRFVGRASLDGAAEGDADLLATDLSPLVHLMGREVPDVVTRLVGETIAVRGDASVAEGGSLHLRSGTVAIGETEVNAAFDLVPGEDRPLLRGTITGGRVGISEALEIDALVPNGAWSRTPYDVSGLFAIDADLTVRAEMLTLGGLALDAPDLRISLTRGRLVVDIARAGIADGQLAGQFVVNGRGGLSVGGDLLLANARASAFAEAVPALSGAEARGSASIEFLGVGADLYTILDGLEAEGDLSLGQGQIVGVDLAGLALNAETLSSATEFDALVAEFRVRGGVVTGDDVQVIGPWGQFVAEGGVDLAERRVDVRLTPEVWEDARATPVPVVITGPWAALVAEPDAEVVAQLAAAAAAERARAAEVARILGGTLDVLGLQSAEEADAGGEVEAEDEEEQEIAE